MESTKRVSVVGLMLVAGGLAAAIPAASAPAPVNKDKAGVVQCNGRTQNPAEKAGIQDDSHPAAKGFYCNSKPPAKGFFCNSKPRTKHTYCNAKPQGDPATTQAQKPNNG